MHVDHHAIWIDPTDPKRIIQGNDGGAYLSLDGAKTWRFLDGMTLEQDYMVRVRQQRARTTCARACRTTAPGAAPPAPSPTTQVTGNDWFAVTGGDGEYTVPAPSDPDIVYVDSQDGAIIQLQHSRPSARIFTMPYLHGPGFMADMQHGGRQVPLQLDLAHRGLPQRRQDGLPGRQRAVQEQRRRHPLDRTLRRPDPRRQEQAGRSPAVRSTRTSPAPRPTTPSSPSPSRPRTRKSSGWAPTTAWCSCPATAARPGTHVTPSGAPKWARVYQVGVSPYDAGTAYVGFDGHELDDKHAYVYKTDDYGKSWSRHRQGPAGPAGDWWCARDPNKKGFLMLGNMTGLWYSRDAGDHWQQVKAGFPTVPVFDLKFVDHDLAVATHGRGLFVFDDLRPFEQLDDSVASQDFHLFDAGDGTHFVTWFRGGETQPAMARRTRPAAWCVDYYLKKEIKNEGDDDKTPVKIVVTDCPAPWSPPSTAPPSRASTATSGTCSTTPPPSSTSRSSFDGGVAMAAAHSGPGAAAAPTTSRSR